MNNCTYIFIEYMFSLFFINVYVHIERRFTVQCGIVSACVCAHACNHTYLHAFIGTTLRTVCIYAASKNVPYLKQQ